MILKKLHQSLQDPFIGSVEIIDQQDARSSGRTWYPVRYGVGHPPIIAHHGQSVKIAHLFKLCGGDVGEVVPPGSRIGLDQLGLSDACASPDADGADQVAMPGRQQFRRMDMGQEFGDLRGGTFQAIAI